jgi:hypothetical protein
MNVRRRICALGATLVVAGVGATGCSDDAAHPKPLPSKSTHASGTPSSTTKPPPLPSDARGTNAKAAESFVSHWVDVLNYSGPAGTSVSLRRLSSSRCVDCDAIADAIDTVTQHGGAIVGRGWTVKSMQTARRSTSWTVRTQVVVHPQQVVMKQGAPARKFAGGKRLKVFSVVHTSDSWRVTKLDQSSG